MYLFRVLHLMPGKCSVDNRDIERRCKMKRVERKSEKELAQTQDWTKRWSQKLVTRTQGQKADVERRNPVVRGQGAVHSQCLKRSVLWVTGSPESPLSFLKKIGHWNWKSQIFLFCLPFSRPCFKSYILLYILMESNSYILQACALKKKNVSFLSSQGLVCFGDFLGVFCFVFSSSS